MTATFELAEEQVKDLRKRFPYMPSRRWVGTLARKRGWLEANVTYLEGERKRAAAAMRHLMAELGVSTVTSVEQATALLVLAFQVFAPEDGFFGSIERNGGTVRVEAVDCPVYRALEESGWLTVTACPSWHRRRGWIDALGVQATDTVLSEMKWGDAACVSLIEVKRVL